MGEDSKPKKLTDDVENLFDLIKEGASYLLHIYLYFISKSFPLEFLENLFDHHKNSSSYDYSKEGKTYIYRLFNAIFEIEKQIVAMTFHYVYSYIPVPFIKNIYENFCVNNNLECTDVKLKNCKKALINSSKLSKKKRDESKNNDEDDDPVSRPFPSISRNPTPKPGNTVSVPLGILVNSPQKNSNRNLTTQEYSSVRPSDNFNKTSPIYTSAPSLSSGETLQLSSSIRKPSILTSSPGSTNNSKETLKKISSENDSPSITHAAKNSIATTNESKSSIQNRIDRIRITADSLSTAPSVPIFENPFEGSRARILSSSEPHNTFLKPSQIPIKINRPNLGSTVTPSSGIEEKSSTPSVESSMVISSESSSVLSSSNPSPSSTFAKTENGKNSNTNNAENHRFIQNTFSIAPSSVNNNKSPNSIPKDIKVPSDETSKSSDPNANSSTLVNAVLLPSTKSSGPISSPQKPVDVSEELDTARALSSSSARNSISSTASRTKIDANTNFSLEMSESLKPSTITGKTDIEISLSKYLPASVHENLLDSEKTKSINQSSSVSESSAKNKINSSEDISESAQNSKIFHLPSFPAQNKMPLSEKQAEVNQKHNSAVVDSVPIAKVAANPDPSIDLARLFDPSPTVTKNISKAPHNKAQTDSGSFVPELISGPPASESTPLPSGVEADQSPLLDISKIFNPSSAPGDISESPNEKSTKKADSDPIPPTTPSTVSEGLVTEIPNPFSDLGKLFETSSTTSVGDNETVFPDLFAPDTASSKIPESPKNKTNNESGTYTPKLVSSPSIKSDKKISSTSVGTTDIGSSMPKPSTSSSIHNKVGDPQTKKSTDQSKLVSQASLKNELDPSEGLRESSAQNEISNLPHLPSTPALPRSKTQVVVSQKQISNERDLVASSGDSTKSKTVSESKVSENPDPFADLAKLFDPSPAVPRNMFESSDEKAKTNTGLFIPQSNSDPESTDSSVLPSGTKADPLSDISKIFNPSSVSGDILESPNKKATPSSSNTPSKVRKGGVEGIPNPFSDIAKLFDTSPTTSGKDNETVFPDLFASDTSSSKIPKNETNNKSATNTNKLVSGSSNKSDKKIEANMNPSPDVDKHFSSRTSIGKTDMGSLMLKPSTTTMHSNVADSQTAKSTNQSSLVSVASLRNERNPSEGSSESSAQNENSNIPHLPSTPALPLPKKQAELSKKQNINDRDLTPSPGHSESSTVSKTKVSNPDPFADLAKLFDPSPTVPRNIFESSDDKAKTHTGVFNPQSSPPDTDSTLLPSEITANPLLDIFNPSPASGDIFESSNKKPTKKADPISSKSVPDTSPISPATPSKGMGGEIPNPFSDLAKLFDPSPTSNETDNGTLFPELFPTDPIEVLESTKEKPKNEKAINPFELNSGSSNETKIEKNLDPFSDIAELFNPSQSTNNQSLISDPFAPNTTSSNDRSSLLIPKQTLPSPLFPGTSPPTLLNIFQPSNTKTTEKNGESVAPVPKNIFPTVDLGTSLDRTIEQNNKAFEKNMQDFGQSISNVFSGGLNAPKPVPSSHGSSAPFCLENMESYNRILSIPIVNSGLNIAENMYGRIKRTNNMLSWTLDQAEDTIKAVTHNPAIGLLEMPLNTIDRAICKSLDIVESRIPSINLPPKMIYSNTKDYLSDVSTKIVKPVLKRADSVKQIGNTVLTSKYTEYAADKLDDALDVADAYIEKYFPDQEDAKLNQDISPKASNSRALHTIKHVDRVSKKLKRRLTKRTLEHAKIIKEQGSEAIHVLIYVAELILTDPKLALQKGKELWAELSKNEPENQARPGNVEELFVLVVRESARCLVHLINYSSAEITRLPRLIVKTIEGSKSVIIRNSYALAQSFPLEEVEKFVSDAMKFIRQEIKSFTYQVLEQARQPEAIAPSQPITIALEVPKIEINSKAANSKANSNFNNQLRQRHPNEHHGHHGHAQPGHQTHTQHGNHGSQGIKKNGAQSPSRKRENAESKEI